MYATNQPQENKSLKLKEESNAIPAPTNLLKANGQNSTSPSPVGSFDDGDVLSELDLTANKKFKVVFKSQNDLKQARIIVNTISVGRRYFDASHLKSLLNKIKDELELVDVNWQKNKLMYFIIGDEQQRFNKILETSPSIQNLPEGSTEQQQIKRLTALYHEAEQEPRSVSHARGNDWIEKILKPIAKECNISTEERIIRWASIEQLRDKGELILSIQEKLKQLTTSEPSEFSKEQIGKLNQLYELAFTDKVDVNSLRTQAETFGITNLYPQNDLPLFFKEALEEYCKPDSEFRKAVDAQAKEFLERKGGTQTQLSKDKAILHIINEASCYAATATIFNQIFKQNFSNNNCVLESCMEIYPAPERGAAIRYAHNQFINKLPLKEGGTCWPDAEAKGYTRGIAEFDKSTAHSSTNSNGSEKVAQKLEKQRKAMLHEQQKLAKRMDTIEEKIYQKIEQKIEQKLAEHEKERESSSSTSSPNQSSDQILQPEIISPQSTTSPLTVNTNSNKKLQQTLEQEEQDMKAAQELDQKLKKEQEEEQKLKETLKEISQKLRFCIEYMNNIAQTEDEWATINLLIAHNKTLAEILYFGAKAQNFENNQTGKELLEAKDNLAEKMSKQEGRSGKQKIAMLLKEISEKIRPLISAMNKSAHAPEDWQATQELVTANRLIAKITAEITHTSLQQQLPSNIASRITLGFNQKQESLLNSAEPPFSSFTQKH